MTDDPVAAAIAAVRARATGARLDPSLPVTIHFQPDLAARDGCTTIEAIAAAGTYRSQFETGTSNGGLTASPGGDRWRWESSMFDAAYDEADPSLRPRYGALDHRRDPYGGAPRFGSAYFEVAPQALDRVTFCFPDSVYEPTDFGTSDRMALLPLVESRPFDDPLDAAIEAHLHGRAEVGRDLPVLVLDPSYRSSAVERAARSLPCELRWHSGYRLEPTTFAEHRAYRGAEIADAGITIAAGSTLTPARLGAARSRFDQQVVKRVWHHLACFGRHRPAWVIGLDSPVRSDVVDLLQVHLEFAHAVTPDGHVHALDVDGLLDPAMTFCSARGTGGVLLGVGALRRLDGGHGEIKSMHTAAGARGSGVGRAMVEHLVGEARAAGHGRVSLETGATEAFAPARSLYRSLGFAPCEPFGHYTVNPHSVCMTLVL